MARGCGKVVCSFLFLKLKFSHFRAVPAAEVDCSLKEKKETAVTSISLARLVPAIHPSMQAGFQQGRLH